MLMNREESCVLLVDVQQKLTPHVDNKEAMIQNCAWVLRLAKAVNIPILTSEQYPNGLGSTLEELGSITSQPPIPKLSFSSWQEPVFVEAFKALGKEQAIIIGIETHVCVLQTALDLLQVGYQVFVVVDAVSSRNAQDYRYGLKRMKALGVQLVTKEMVFFEWLKAAGTREFKTLSQSFMR